MSTEDKEAVSVRPQRKPSRATPKQQTLSKVAWRTLPWLILIATVVGYKIQGVGFSILILAATLMLATIALLWGSLRSLLGETQLPREAAFAMGAPSAEEEQKRAVLRAIKDLEFELSVGKISEEDYEQTLNRYRAEAKSLLRRIDARQQPERERVVAMVNVRLREEGLLDEAGSGYRDKSAAASSDDAGPPEAEAEELADEESDTSTAEPSDLNENRTESDTACPECDTENDADAMFCKRCGEPLEEEGDAEEGEA